MKIEAVPGIELIYALVEQAEKLGMDKHQLAEAIGISYTYLSALSTGARPIKALGHDRLRQMAEFLNCTVVDVMMLGGILEPLDFVISDTDALDHQLTQGFKMLRKDPTWSHLAPKAKEWEGLSRELKLLIVLLYERETQRDLIDKTQRAQMLSSEKVKALKDMRAVEDDEDDVAEQTPPTKKPARRRA